MQYASFLLSCSDNNVNAFLNFASCLLSGFQGLTSQFHSRIPSILSSFGDLAKWIVDVVFPEKSQVNVVATVVRVPLERTDAAGPAVSVPDVTYWIRDV